MKRILLITVIFMVMAAHAQLRLTAQSPRACTKQAIGLMEVEISHSRPSIRERTIFGELPPNNEVWRIGANTATKIAFSGDVLIDGKVLKKGSCSLWPYRMNQHGN